MSLLVFTGSFQVPTNYCATDGDAGETDSVTGVTGTDIEVNYNDFRERLVSEKQFTEASDGTTDARRTAILDALHAGSDAENSDDSNDKTAAEATVDLSKPD
jgi:hypothetical protein